MLRSNFNYLLQLATSAVIVLKKHLLQYHCHATLKKNGYIHIVLPERITSLQKNANLPIYKVNLHTIIENKFSLNYTRRCLATIIHPSQSAKFILIRFFQSTCALHARQGKKYARAGKAKLPQSKRKSTCTP